MRRIAAALAAVACMFGAAATVPSIAAAETQAAISAESWSEATNDCLRYTGCRSLSRWYSDWYDGGYAGVDSYTAHCYAYHTDYYGWKYTEFVYGDLWLYPDKHSYYRFGASKQCSRIYLR